MEFKAERCVLSTKGLMCVYGGGKDPWEEEIKGTGKRAAGGKNGSLCVWHLPSYKSLPIHF